MRAASIESGPIFRRVRRGDKVIGAAPLSTRAARAIIQRRAAAADLQGRFSGHSLRVGAAQSLAAGDASPGGDADRRALAVSVHARPLCQGSACGPWGRGQASLRQVIYEAMNHLRHGQSKHPAHPPGSPICALTTSRATGFTVVFTIVLLSLDDLALILF